jgi:Peptidase family M23
VGIGKKIATTIAVLALGGLFVGPIAVGAAGALLSGGNSCTAVSQSTPAEAGTLTGISAQDFLNAYDDFGQKSRLSVAREIYSAGMQRQPAESLYAVTIAIAVGMQESGLVNLTGGDRDSAGVFQQRPSQNWGTYEQVTNVTFAANSFFDTLDGVKSIEGRPMIEVAIEVQRPDPKFYYRDWKWDKAATEIVAMVVAPGASKACAQGGWINPLQPGYDITDPYGMRFDPFTGERKMHNGVDLASDLDTPVYAASSGTVSFAGVLGGYGNYIKIDHTGGVESAYGHLNAFAAGLQQGTVVKAGDLIGYMGSTGRSTGEHLHFEVKLDGQFVDPVVYMEGVGIKL